MNKIPKDARSNKDHYDAIFLLDQIPFSNVGGAPSYNASLIRASEALGWKVLIIVTGPRLPAPVFDVNAFNKNTNIAFTHAIQIRKNRFLTSTFSSASRAVKRLAERIKKTRPPKSNKIAVIERYPTKPEVRRVRKILSSLTTRLIFVDTIFRDPYVNYTDCPGRRILIGHDIFHQRVASFEKNGYSVTPRISSQSECDVVRQYDDILAISKADAEIYKAMTPQSRVQTMYPIVPKAENSQPFAADSERILYIGSAAHHNVDGLVWFLENVWPEIITRHPTAHLDVVGAVGQAISPYPNVTIHGRVEDISSVANRASFAINPVLMGSGLKIKMVDYFNIGLGCVTTSIGAHGFPPEGRPFLTVDDAAQFSSAVCYWLDNPIECEKTSKLSMPYMNNFSLESAVKIFEHWN